MKCQNQVCFLGQKKKNMSSCLLLKILPRVLSVKKKKQQFSGVLHCIILFQVLQYDWFRTQSISRQVDETRDPVIVA